MKKLVLLTLLISASFVSVHASDTSLGENRDVTCVEQDQSNRGAKADAEAPASGTQTSPEVRVEDKG